MEKLSMKSVDQMLLLVYLAGARNEGGLYSEHGHENRVFPAG